MLVSNKQKHKHVSTLAYAHIKQVWRVQLVSHWAIAKSPTMDYQAGPPQKGIEWQRSSNFRMSMCDWFTKITGFPKLHKNKTQEKQHSHVLGSMWMPQCYPNCEMQQIILLRKLDLAEPCLFQLNVRAIRVAKTRIRTTKTASTIHRYILCFWPGVERKLYLKRCPRCACKAQ